MISSISQQELERLLKESQQIAQDWDTYQQFRQNREAVLQTFMREQGVN